jgi:hypothetical protein
LANSYGGVGMNCNWCGDEMKAGVYEIHKCLQDGEAETASAE